MRDRRLAPTPCRSRSRRPITETPPLHAQIGGVTLHLGDAGAPVLDGVGDPFGSGTPAVVAAHLGRRAVLIEASEASCDLAVERLRSGK